MEREPSQGEAGSRWKMLLGYGGMLAGTALCFYLIRDHGQTLAAAPPAPDATPFGAAVGAQKVEALPHVLIALLVIMAASRALGAAFRYIQQPAVIGEVLAGILLGPSLLGLVAPDAYAFLLPPSVAPYLGIIAQVGVILFMFLVGLELDTGLLGKKTHATVAISHASIIAPFLLGSALALWLYPKLSSSDVPFTYFALFMGVSMSVTAFPVLARILTDRGAHRTRLGVLALTCAAVDDVTAWCLLAFVVSVVHAEPGGAGITIALAAGYTGLMLLVVGPAIRRFVRARELRGGATRDVTAMALVGLLLSALCTELIGIHALFGAFLFGVMIPHDSPIAKQIQEKLEDLVVVLLLPAFFAYTGMRTQIGLVSGIGHWVATAAIIFVACAGKFGGSTLAARLTGSGWREAASVGVLMNTRGLMELIVLNIGLDMKVISPTLFAMLVIMALVTTFATTPVLHLLTRKDDLPQGAAARGAA